MRALRVVLCAGLLSLACSGQTLSKWNGITLGSSTGNISSMNGKTVGTATGNYGKWNGVAVPASGGGVVPSIVQSKSTGTGGPVGTLALTSSVTSGNVLIAAMYYGVNGATLTFTHTQGSAATQLASQVLSTDGDTVAIACAPITSSGTDTVTFQVDGANNSVFAVVYEAHNATCTQDVTAVAPPSSVATACSSGPMTTSTANDLLIGACGTDGTATTVAAGSGWTGGLNAGGSGHTQIMSESQIATSPGSFTATSGTIPSEEQASVMVALQP